MQREIVDQKVEALKKDLGEIETSVLTEGLKLSDAIRQGSSVTTQEFNWGDGANACALSAATVSAVAHGLR